MFQMVADRIFKKMSQTPLKLVKRLQAGINTIAKIGPDTATFCAETDNFSVTAPQAPVAPQKLTVSGFKKLGPDQFLLQ